MAKVILSRKGFDASAGGSASPILPDGRMLSLPIPESGTGARYGDVRTSWGQTYAEVMRAAGITSVRMAGGTVPLSDDLEAHLDPDLVAATRRRPTGWRPAFGQAGAAQTILARAGVGPGDLFLFFGWFREPGSRRDVHAIWGWLRIGEVVTPSRALRRHADHPHVVLSDRVNNTLYVAADEALPGIPGAGTVTFAPDLVLTAPDARGRADWLLPAALARTTVLPRHATRFGQPSDGTVSFDARYQWQEFVADATPAVRQWAETLLHRHARPPT